MEGNREKCNIFLDILTLQNKAFSVIFQVFLDFCLLLC